MATPAANIFLNHWSIPQVYPGVTGQTSTDFQFLLPNFGSFNSEGNYIYTPEGEKFKERFEKQSGKTLTIKPFSEKNIKDRPNSYGFYIPTGPGGHTDLKNRTIYLGPEGNSVDVITHEAGHALDPNLNNNRSFYFNKNPFKHPKEFLTQYVKAHPLFKDETEAQRASISFLEEEGIPTGGIRSNPWFKGYPASYVDENIQDVTELLSRPNVPRAAEPVMKDYFEIFPTNLKGKDKDVAKIEVDFKDRRAKNRLNLMLNPSYQMGVQQSLDYARNYLDHYLGY
jgi:hypothetical protein